MKTTPDQFATALTAAIQAAIHERHILPLRVAQCIANASFYYEPVQWNGADEVVPYTPEPPLLLDGSPDMRIGLRLTLANTSMFAALRRDTTNASDVTISHVRRSAENKHRFTYRPQPGDTFTQLCSKATACGRDLDPDDPRANWIDTSPHRKALTIHYHDAQAERYEREDW